MKQLAILMPLLILAGCDSVSGEYGGPDCSPYEKISLKSNGTAYIAMYGSEMSAPYTVDGDKISITFQGAGVVFTKKDDAIESGMPMGMKAVCKKL